MVCVGCLGLSEQRWQGGGPTLNPVLEGHLNQGAVAIVGLANPLPAISGPLSFPTAAQKLSQKHSR